jgi:hypothetical protein
VGAQVCTKCGQAVVAEPFAPSPHAPPPPIPGSPTRPTIPGTEITLGDGEHVWKRYAVSYIPEFRFLGIRLSRATGTGTLFVTNARVLFYAAYERRGGKRSTLIQETQVENVTGLSAFVSRSFSLVAAFVVLILGLSGLEALKHEAVGEAFLLLLLCGVGAYLMSQGHGQRGSVGVSIHSGSSEKSPLNFGLVDDRRSGFGAALRSLLGPFGRLLFGAGGQSAFDLLIAPPGPDAEQVVQELGALIGDLRSKGGLAGTHWGVDG